MRTTREFARLGIAALAVVLAAPPARAAIENLYVGNLNPEQVLSYNAVTGASQGVVGTLGHGNAPSGIAIGPDGALYVGNLGTSEVDRIVDGVVTPFVTSGSGGLAYPGGIAFYNGDLFVSSHNTDSVIEYNGSTGALIGTFASGNGLSGPTGLTFFGGNLFVSSGNSSQVLEYSGSTGAFIGVFATGNGLNAPASLVFGPDNNLYVADFFGNDVREFNGTTGAFIQALGAGSPLSRPSGLVFGPNGDLLVASQGTSQILEFNPTTGAYVGVFIDAGVGGLNGPNYLALGPGGLPEPSSVALLGLGLLGALAGGRLARRRAG